MEAVFKVCYVVWTDVMHFKRDMPDGWLSHDELQTLIDESSSSVGLQMKSVGWLVHQDADKLVLTGTMNEFSASDVIVIPRALVRDFRVLDDPPSDPSHGRVPVIVLPDSPRGESEGAQTTQDDAIRLTPVFSIKRAANDAG